jgi:hypothetical protein
VFEIMLFATLLFGYDFGHIVHADIRAPLFRTPERSRDVTKTLKLCLYIS